MCVQVSQRATLSLRDVLPIRVPSPDGSVKHAMVQVVHLRERRECGCLQIPFYLSLDRSVLEIGGDVATTWFAESISPTNTILVVSQLLCNDHAGPLKGGKPNDGRPSGAVSVRSTVSQA